MCSRFCLQLCHILSIKGLPSAKWSLTAEELKDLVLHSGSYTMTILFLPTIIVKNNATIPCFPNVFQISTTFI